MLVMVYLMFKKALFEKPWQSNLSHYLKDTPRPHTALLMCQEKYSAIGISAIGNY